jgi:hypothetical protein
MNYTAPAPAGILLQKHSVNVTSSELQNLNTTPINLISNIANLNKGLIVFCVTITGQVLANSPNTPFFLGNLNRLRDNTKFCWSEFSTKDIPSATGELFHIHLQQNPKKEDETHWNVEGSNASGLSNTELYLYQTSDSATFQTTFGLFINIYWIDEFNYNI